MIFPSLFNFLTVKTVDQGNGESGQQGGGLFQGVPNYQRSTDTYLTSGYTWLSQ